jgi:hypothetical protein
MIHKEWNYNNTAQDAFKQCDTETLMRQGQPRLACRCHNIRHLCQRIGLIRAQHHRFLFHLYSSRVHQSFNFVSILSNCSTTGIRAMLFTLVLSAFVAIALYKGFNAYQSWQSNIVLAKSSGLPVVVIPWNVFSVFWLATFYIWIPILEVILPSSWRGVWFEYVVHDRICDGY